MSNGLPQSFHGFPRLPFELRRIIWKSTKQYQSTLDTPSTITPEDFIEQRRAPHILLSICQETREIYLADHHKLTLGGLCTLSCCEPPVNRIPRYIFFNCKRDILRLDDDHTMLLFNGIRCHNFKHPDFQPVRILHLEASWFQCAKEYSMSIPQLVEALPNLKEVVFYLKGLDREGTLRYQIPNEYAVSTGRGLSSLGMGWKSSAAGVWWEEKQRKTIETINKIFGLEFTSANWLENPIVKAATD